MYRTISRSRLESLYRKAETLIAQRGGTDSELSFIQACYTPANALAGCTDYQDHRNDRLPQVKRMIRENIKTRQCQTGSYYNTEGQPFDQVRVELRNGGWSAYPQWSDGSRDFFTEERQRSAERWAEIRRTKKL